jgi:hypothetical protein
LFDLVRVFRAERRGGEEAEVEQAAEYCTFHEIRGVGWSGHRVGYMSGLILP